MKKLIAAFVLLASTSAPAQTLFYYGKDSVSVNEFLAAYRKNNTGVRTEKAFMDYLGLYINSRLKIAEAKARGYDTLPQLVSDLEGLRQQILPSYVTDKESIGRLLNEAFTRSQKDIHLAHIFIASKYGVDTAEAAQKLEAVKAALKKGTAFAALAKQYSDDPMAKVNGGDVGWITVFTLPYELENLAYTTAVGKTSAVYRSKAGYHIFKNLGERKDPGQLKVAEILLALPPGADEVTKARVKELADSLYHRILKGDDLGKLAAQYSNDMVSAAANGVMPEFGTGQYDAVFEKTVFALPKDGAVSPPFLTSHGYHIVKRLGKTPAAAVKTEEVMARLREKVEQSDRMKSTRTALAKKVLKEAGYQKAAFATAELWAYTDSVLNSQVPRTALHLSSGSPVFSFRDKSFLVSDWIGYAQTFRYKADGSGVKPYEQVWDEFVEASALDYYQAHLEAYNEEFRQQLNEFRDGNLFFEIMQRQVWGPAQSDSAALAAYYEKNKEKYNWKQSADAVIFYANDAATAQAFSQEMKKAPADWQQLVNDMSEKIAADSSRFELGQIPNPTKLPWKAGTLTAPLLNKADNTASFAYIVHYYPQTAPRSFADAKGLVITDYQNELEKSWLEALRKQYPVRMNEAVLSELKKKKQY